MSHLDSRLNSTSQATQSALCLMDALRVLTHRCDRLLQELRRKQTSLESDAIKDCLERAIRLYQLGIDLNAVLVDCVAEVREELNDAAAQPAADTTEIEALRLALAAASHTTATFFSASTRNIELLRDSAFRIGLRPGVVETANAMLLRLRQGRPVA